MPGKLVNIVVRCRNASSRWYLVQSAPMLVRRSSDALAEGVAPSFASRILMDAGELGSRNMSVTWLEVPAGAEQALRSHEEAEQVYVVVRGTGARCRSPATTRRSARAT